MFFCCSSLRFLGMKSVFEIKFIIIMIIIIIRWQTLLDNKQWQSLQERRLGCFLMETEFLALFGTLSSLLCGVFLSQPCSEQTEQLPTTPPGH